MIILRWITLGLLGCILGCVITLCRQRPPAPHEHRAVDWRWVEQNVRHRSDATPLRVVDVAAGADPAQFFYMICTDFNDRIAAVDDTQVASTLAGIELMRAHPPKHGEYVDVTLANERTHTDKRVLLLMH